VRVEEVRGDLLAKDVDVLLNPWNRNFVPRWLLRPGGVSGQLKRRTGPSPWRQLARTGMLPPGAAVLTDGGRLPISLIHVAGIKAFWKASSDSVTMSCQNAVQLAWTAGFQTMALPLIGSGHGSLSLDESLQALRQALRPLNSDSGEAMTVRIVLRS